MTTLPCPFVANGVVSAWESEYTSATFSGIVGDAAHQRNGGYHISIEDQSTDNYSCIRPDDKAPPGNWSRKHATALDMSMSKADMVKSTNRWKAVWADKTDPRRIYFNGFNGWTGSGDAQRWDFVTNTVKTSTNDHQWHQHSEKRRRYWNDPKADRAMVSIARGETKTQWLANESGIGGDDNMLCKYGDGNQKGPDGKRIPDQKVTALQEQLLQLDPECLPAYGSDGGYGDEVSVAVSRLVTGGDGHNYDGKAFALLQKLTQQKNGAGSGAAPALVPHTHTFDPVAGQSGPAVP